MTATLNSENIGNLVWRATVTDDQGNVVGSAIDGIRFVAERHAVMVAESKGYILKHDKGSPNFIDTDYKEKIVKLHQKGAEVGKD